MLPSAGAVFRQVRLRRGLNQTAFADGLGCSRASICAVESGGNVATLERVADLMVRAGATPDDIRALGSAITADLLDKHAHDFVST